MSFLQRAAAPGLLACLALPCAAGPAAAASGGAPAHEQVPARLTLVKRVVNGGEGRAAPGDWTLSAARSAPADAVAAPAAASAAAPAIAGASGTPQVTGRAVEAGAAYRLAQSGGPSGYRLEAPDCRTRAGDPVPVRHGAVVPARGQDVVCVFVAVDDAGARGPLLPLSALQLAVLSAVAGTALSVGIGAGVYRRRPRP
ncbi:hypothetical protein [Actinomadura parmotrematis]|uniref:SpaA-like prealbumin fold domain-containing protein n=1 Tax=Actinomadura parmotrematis TaxID=2864039 RepID=A0ABS7G398_9ACTN|nr:hypothetical protein [Actinomadura parmotrematis]MBW8487183.1 hypothetical protein [Actinomadura parmotrematis]